MNSARPKSSAVSSRRLVRLTVVAVVAVPFLLGGFYWLNGQIPRAAYWKAGLIFLIGIEALYVITAAVTLPAVVVIASLLFARRTDRIARQKLARGLLLGVSLIIWLVARRGRKCGLARSAVIAAALRYRPAAFILIQNSG